MNRLSKLKNIFNKDITDTLQKHKILLISILVVFLFACIGIFITYAYYQVSDITPIIGGSTGKIADLEVRIMAEERDTNGNGLGSYALYPYIPQAGYAYNEAKSYCTNGSSISYDANNYQASITATSHDVCYLYFDSTANLDLTLNVYAQNIDSDGYGIENDYTKLETTALPSIGYVLNVDKSSCENGSDLSYNAEENMFTIEANGKDVCTAYMDAIDVDIQVKLYIQAKAGSGTYYESDSIPTNNYYELGSKSACTGTSTLSIQNQKVVIAATSKTSCVAYLDVASGPIIESMNVEMNGTTANITLSNSDIGTSPTTYYYSSNGGESWDSATTNTYSYSNIGNGTTKFMAYTTDASGKASAILETNEYILNGIYDYSNAVQTVTIEKSGYYYLQVWGAQGGTYNATYAPGGLGGYSEGYVYLNAGDTLYVHTGGQGSYGTTNSTTAVSGGGTNGGGNAGYRGGGGGGGTDIRINQDDLLARVIVAGGGGGSFYKSSSIKAVGGAGGGTSGVDGGYHSSSYAYYNGKGGTQTAGGAGGTAEVTKYYGQAGSFGVGGNTGNRYQSTTIYSNGAGGGGWYGGGGSGHYNGSSNTRYTGGGGGSGYIYTESTAANYPEGCLLNSNYYLQNASTHAGNTAFESPSGQSETGHAGNGYAKITYVGQSL